MRKDFLFIMFLILMSFLTGCRASKESKARSERTAESEIGVELRKADSLWSSIAERLNFKIEFYPLEYSIGNGTPTAFTGASLPAAPCSTVPAGVANPLPWQAQGVGAGGMGAVKSIEITTERTEDRSVITATDSVLEQKTASTETRQEEKASELRQDNGTWAILAVVAAVVFILILLIVIRKFFK